MFREFYALFCALFLPITLLQGAEIPELYKSSPDLPFDDHGWFSHEASFEKFLTPVKSIPQSK